MPQEPKLTFQDLREQGLTFDQIFALARKGCPRVTVEMTDEEACVAHYAAYFSREPCGKETLIKEFHLHRTGEWPLERLSIHIYGWALKYLVEHPKELPCAA